MQLSRRSFLIAAAAAPLGARLALAAAPPGAVVAADDRMVGWFGATLREPIPGTPRLALDGEWGIALSADGSQLLVRTYFELPFELKVAPTDTLVVAETFREPASSVKGAVLRWPSPDRLLIADPADGRVALVDPLAGRVLHARRVGASQAGSSLACAWRNGAVLLLRTPHHDRVVFVDGALHVVADVPVRLAATPGSSPGLTVVGDAAAIVDRSGIVVVHPDRRRPAHLHVDGLPRAGARTRLLVQASTVEGATLLVEVDTPDSWAGLVDLRRARARRLPAGGAVVAPGLVACITRDGALSVVDAGGRERGRLSPGSAPFTGSDAVWPYVTAVTRTAPQERAALDLRTFQEVARGVFADRAPGVVTRAA